jgi:hypothetical protein
MTHPGIRVARVLADLPYTARVFWRWYRARPWLTALPFLLGVVVGALHTLHRLGKL